MGQFQNQNKPVINVGAIQNGLLKIGQLLDEGLNWVSYNELVNRYGNVISMLEYNGIKSAFPEIWKILIKRQVHGSREESMFYSIPKKNNISQFCYQYFVENKYDTEN